MSKIERSDGRGILAGDYLNENRTMTRPVSYTHLKYRKASRETMIQDGRIHPSVEMTAPPKPAIWIPTKVAEFTAMGPGVIWEMVIRSVNSVMVST